MTSKPEKGRRVRFSFLCLLGLMLILYAAFVLQTRTPALSQYAFSYDNDVDMAKTFEGLRDELAANTERVSLHGEAHGQSVSAGSRAEDGVTVYAVSEMYFSLYPRRVQRGEVLSPYALRNGDKSIVLDEKLAFRLFGSESPIIGEKVILSGKEYTVTGTVAWHKGYGDVDAYAAFVPLLGLPDGLTPEVMIASTLSGLEGGLSARFESAAKEKLPAGSFISLHKERMRAYMPLYLIALVASALLLKAGLRFISARVIRWYGQVQERLRSVYPRQAMGYILVRVLGTAALIAAYVTGFAMIMRFFTRPMLVFVEWVPENLVSFGAIRTRFYELLKTAAAPVRFITPDYAQVTFCAFLIRWGTMLCLIGGLVSALKARKQRNFPS